MLDFRFCQNMCYEIAFSIIQIDTSYSKKRILCEIFPEMLSGSTAMQNVVMYENAWSNALETNFLTTCLKNSSKKKI